MDKSINIFGQELKSCCDNPKTGFYRDGYCNTCSEDYGMHTVCILITENFLEFSKSVGNDLSTPNPVFNFRGLKPGDKWCLCALRFKQAMEDGCAPKVVLEATNEKTLDIVSMDELLEHAYYEK